MEKAWTEVAGVGTGRQDFDSPSPESPVDKLRENLAQGQNELRLLAGAGLNAIQARAAYLPTVSTNPLPMPDEIRPNFAYKTAQLGHLNRLHQGYYARVYLEWLHWAALSKAQLPLEAIPLLLDLGALFPAVYELTKRMVGGRGRWLVRNADNTKWQWLHQVEAGKTPRLGKQKKQEERVITLFKPSFYYQFGANVREELRYLLHPWSLRFSEILLETIVSVMQNQHFSSIDQMGIMRLTQYNIHPHLGTDLMQVFENYRQDPEVLKAVETLGRIIEFRRDIRESFGIVD